MTLQAGATFGRYQILGPLGEGGMATVYKAFQTSLERTVALKVVRAGLAEDPEFKERFEREAKAIARLSHPNIVRAFDFDHVDGQYFMSMEFVEGGTLKGRLRELAAEGRKLPPREVDRIISEVASALAYAHSFGIVHRDMKPANVMLTRDGRAVVTDFGIAKVLIAGGMTAAGVGMGTPEYMSPEQGQGGTIDQRSDIYSLGVMAYEMLTGRVPYLADTPLAVVLAHVRDPLPLPSAIEPSVGPATERVLLRALAKDPAERYGSATELAEALGRAVAEGGGAEREVTQRTVVLPKGGGPSLAPAPTTAADPGRGSAARAGLAIPRVYVALGALLLVVVYGLMAARFGLCPPSGPWPLPPGCA